MENGVNVLKANESSWKAYSESRARAAAVAAIPVADLVKVRRLRSARMSKKDVYESLGMSRVVGARGGVYYE